MTISDESFRKNLMADAIAFRRELIPESDRGCAFFAAAYFERALSDLLFVFLGAFRGVVALALCFPGVLSANVVFPAFSASYVAPMLFPPALVVVLALETAVLRLRWPAVGAWRAAGLVCYVNAISWLFGVFITGYAFPSGYTVESVGSMRRDEDFTLYMCLGFLIAYVLSVVIEGALLASWARKYGAGNPFMVALVGNTYSYVFLGVGWILYMSL